MYILSVIPIASSLNTDTLSYFSAKTCRLGQMVTIPLRKKEVLGIIVGIEEVRDLKFQLRDAHFQIKNVRQIHEQTLFSEAFLNMIQKIREYYLIPQGKLIDQLTPTLILKKLEILDRKVEEHRGQGFEIKLLQQTLHDRGIYYRTLARELLAKKASLHIICPSIEHIKRIHTSVIKGIDEQVITLSSNTTTKQVLEYYQKEHTEASIIISTPQYLDAPQYNKQCIVIEEENSEYYISISKPHIDYRHIIEIFAEQKNIPCIYAASLLRAETYTRKDSGAVCIEPFVKNVFDHTKLYIFQLNKKQGREKQSDQERLAELTKEAQKKITPFSNFCDESLQILKQGIKEKKKIFCYVHKKALAPHIVCRDCGNIAASPESGLPYSLYLKGKNKERIYVCNQTGEQLPAFDICQFCGSWNMMQLGIGSQGVYEELLQRFPKTKIYILDGTTKKKEEREIVKDYETNDAIIIVGTKRALNILPSFDHALFVSIESLFSRMSYRIHEEILSLIIKSMEKSRGENYLQVRNISEHELPILKNGLYPPFIKQELEERALYHYPPSHTIISLALESTITEAGRYHTLLQNQYKKWHPQIFTQPARPGKIRIYTLLFLPLSVWSLDQQDPELKAALLARDRSLLMTINPPLFND